MDEDFLQIFVTTDKKSNAEDIAENLVSKKLATCVQITSPIESTYTWKDNVEKAEEWMLIIKSKVSLFGEVEDEIKRLHRYKVPEIIAHKIDNASEDYLEWMNDNLR